MFTFVASPRHDLRWHSAPKQARSERAAFARRWWDWPRRALFVFATLGAPLTVCFLVRWNYLPATF